VPAVLIFDELEAEASVTEPSAAQTESPQKLSRQKRRSSAGQFSFAAQIQTACGFARSSTITFGARSIQRLEASRVLAMPLW
jgi:hypothetical protein